MKIAIISNTTFNIYNFRLGLLCFLQEKGYEVVYISPPDEYVERMAKKTSAAYFPLKYMSRKGYNPWQELKLIQELKQLFLREKIDLAITYTIKPNIYSAIASRGTHTKVIANFTGLGFVFLKQSIGNLVAKQLIRFGMRSAAAIVFQNKEDLNLFLSKKFVPESKTLLINGSGINLDRYKPIANRSHRPFTFLFVGRLLYDKGIREFIEASSKLHQTHPDITFHLVGALDEGNPSAVSKIQLDQWLSENEQLKFFGHQTEVIPFLEDADVVVLPSYREGIPRVLLEAMAMEIPFVTANSAGCSDVTHHEKNGLLVPVADANALYTAMLKMYNLPAQERKTMGQYGRTLAFEKYDEKIIVQEYLKLILRLTKN